MSDDPLFAFALGSLAASRGANDLAELAASVMAPRHASYSNAGLDTNALIQALQDQERHILQQEEYAEGLRREILELREGMNALIRNRDQIHDWALRAQEELRKRPQS